MTLIELLTPQYGKDASKMVKHLEGYSLESIQSVLPELLSSNLVFPGYPQESAKDIKRAVRKARNPNQTRIAW